MFFIYEISSLNTVKAKKTYFFSLRVNFTQKLRKNGLNSWEKRFLKIFCGCILQKNEWLIEWLNGRKWITWAVHYYSFIQSYFIIFANERPERPTYKVGWTK